MWPDHLRQGVSGGQALLHSSLGEMGRELGVVMLVALRGDAGGGGYHPVTNGRVAPLGGLCPPVGLAVVVRDG